MKRVTRETVSHDAEGNEVRTTVSSKQGGCLAWVFGAFLVVGVVCWPILAIHGWARWLVAAGWWVFLIVAVCVGLNAKGSKT